MKTEESCYSMSPAPPGLPPDQMRSLSYVQVSTPQQKSADSLTRDHSSQWSPAAFLYLWADPTCRKVSNNLTLHSILWMRENSQGYDFINCSAMHRHINGVERKQEEAVRIFRCATPSFGAWGDFYPFHHKTHFSPHFTQSRTFLARRAPPSLALCAQPLSPARRRRAFLSFRGTVLPPLPRTPSLPFKWWLFCFFLLVSSNTYIVWGETASIHTPQKAIHSRAAGEAQCSACPLHSWMSFVQSSGLESFPSQSQAINERWKKERKCRRVLSSFTICSFYVCL